MNEETKGLNGSFTKHLKECGLYKNNGLNTYIEKDRVINGSKDWMDHLN